MSARYKLLIISFSRLVSDARILKQINLFKDKYELTTCGYGPAPKGVSRHVQIPDNCVYWKRNRLAMILRLYRLSYWSSTAVKYAAEHLPRDQFHVVFADDIDTAGLALYLRPKCGVHCDLHEYSPREKEDVPRWRLFVAPYMRWQVKAFVAKAASVTSTSTRFREEYLKNFGVDSQVVVNAAPYADLAPTKVPDTGPIRLVHAGAGVKDRFLELMIQAVAALPNQYTLDMYLTPNNVPYIESLREKAKEIPNVKVLDAVDYPKLIPTLNKYAMGIHNLPPVNFNNHYALPNKFFDFVQARLGMVIGPTPEMVKLLQEYDLGVAAQGFTAQDLTQALKQVSREQVVQWKENAHAHARALSAEKVVDIWQKAVSTIIEKNCKENTKPV